MRRPELTNFSSITTKHKKEMNNSSDATVKCNLTMKRQLQPQFVMDFFVPSALTIDNTKEVIVTFDDG